ncbi:heterogeneous nuclear ribonucleoprotein Q-like isoform X2 [Impatiens glandulifera]|uniref:heterogeneous nuclear ribonucleoprotein Q-like isoform X2 n=1 Tax=Impatiens glandulifera TaxID=253017 RepID=UPI001FB053FB|nr:heterogeneous nuclear ribonucleoprotein Q-like isoform X2 [Impatiens glandulifera]
MPPKSARKTVIGAGSKRGGRAGRGTPRTLNKKLNPEEIKADDSPSDVKHEVKIDENKTEEKRSEITPIVPKPVIEPVTETKPEIVYVDDDVLPLKKEDDIKESTEEYEKDERLDLDDNEPDYEVEEYVGDYDEKEIEHDDVEREGDEVDEEAEREEEGDMVEEEIEDQCEELEGEEEDGHVSEEQPEMADGEEEHHDVFKERRKRKEFEIFVGGLDKEATEDDLRKVFKDVGEVTEVRLLMNPQTKKNKGFAFLRFATIEQAKRACTEIKNPVVNGKQCGVTPSQDSDTLFLGNICRTWTKEALKAKLKHYGIDSIQDLTLVEDSNNEGTNRGFAFLEFYSRPVAMEAFKRLQKKDVAFGVDRPPKVSFADSFIDPGDEIMSQVKTVFIDGLLASWDEDRMRDLLKAYGAIEKIELARNMPSAKRKDFGFVTFTTHDSAITCAKNINNEELGEGNNKIKVRARLSRPLNRGKGKHVIRDPRPRRGSTRSGRAPWSRPPIQRGPPPVRSTRVGNRPHPPSDRGLKRPISSRDRRPVVSISSRARPLHSPPRSYDRRPPPGFIATVPSYSKSSMKRDYGRREQPPPPPRSSRDTINYGSRAMDERRHSHRDDYPTRSSGYTDLPRSSSRSKRPYVEDSYGQRYERPPPPLPPSYREGRDRDYDPLPGSKRPYSSMDDIPSRYADSGVPHSRARLDYDLGGGSSQYVNAYSDRMVRSSLGYGGGGGSSRAHLSGQESHSLYGSRHSMGYAGGSYGGGGSSHNHDIGGMYPSSGYGHDSEYISRRSDVSGGSGSGSGSYPSSMYSGRGMGGGGGSSSYMGGGSGSYY